MSYLSDLAQHWGETIQNNEPNWASRLPRMPGSAQSLTDAMAQNQWSHPFSGDANSMDTFLGGSGHPASSDQPWARNIGRGIGSLFGGYGLYSLGAGALGSGAGSGPVELGGGWGGGTASSSGAATDAAFGSGGATEMAGAGGGSGAATGTGGGLWGRGGAGQYGIGGLFALLQGLRSKKDAKMSEADKQALAQSAANVRARSLSSTVGNPALSGGAEQEIQNASIRELARYAREDRSRSDQANAQLFGGGGMLTQALMAYLGGR